MGGTSALAGSHGPSCFNETQNVIHKKEGGREALTEWSLTVEMTPATAGGARGGGGW